jgi:hypothetical protein
MRHCYRVYKASSIDIAGGITKGNRGPGGGEIRGVQDVVIVWTQGAARRARFNIGAQQKRYLHANTLIVTTGGAIDTGRTDCTGWPVTDIGLDIENAWREPQPSPQHVSAGRARFLACFSYIISFTVSKAENLKKKRRDRFRPEREGRRRAWRLQNQRHYNVAKGPARAVSAPEA